MDAYVFERRLGLRDPSSRRGGPRRKSLLQELAERRVPEADLSKFAGAVTVCPPGDATHPTKEK